MSNGSRWRVPPVVTLMVVVVLVVCSSSFFLCCLRCFSACRVVRVVVSVLVLVVLFSCRLCYFGAGCGVSISVAGVVLAIATFLTNSIS